MAMEQQFRVYGPYSWGQGTTAATLTATQNWSSANFAGGSDTGGVLAVPFFVAARIRGLAIAVTTAIATTAPIFTTTVRPVITATGGTGTGRAVNATATVLLTAIAGDVYYHFFNDDDVKVNPGEQVVVTVSTAASTGAGYVGLIVSEFLVGPTSGGTVTVPVSRSKPYGTGTGTIKITSSTSSGN